MSVFLILGTRPQIIKSTPVILEAEKQSLNLKVVHTGQHYDYSLSQLFFDELSPPQPFINLDVGSGTQIYQISEIILRLEKLLDSEKPRLIVVPGDTNSALAAAIASVKRYIHLAHLESGARSYDMKMIEEINRCVIDHCAQILFVTTNKCKDNLEKESVLGEIYQCGDTMFDSFEIFKTKAEKNGIVNKLNLEAEEFAILTTHRAENVDDPKRLHKILSVVLQSGMSVVFPVHPRTRERLKDSGISFDGTNIIAIDPMGYIEMLALLKKAKLVLTDSGGLQKEAFWSKTPCITIRDRTEWTETIDLGVNFITDVDPERMKSAIKQIDENYSDIKNRFKTNPFGDGKASEKIVKILKEKIS